MLGKLAHIPSEEIKSRILAEDATKEDLFQLANEFIEAAAEGKQDE